jgi:hypothetical protein
MSTERDTTRIVRSWLRTDEHESADRVLDAVLDQIDATPQRRATWWPARRFLDMSTPFRWGAVAVAAVALAIVGIAAFRGGGVGTSIQSPSNDAASHGASPSATPVENGSLPAAGAIAPGSYLIDDPFPVHLGLQIGPGWSMWGGPFDRQVGAIYEGSPDDHGIIFVIVHNTYADACDAAAGSSTPAIGPTVDDLAAALVAQASTESSAPVAVTIDGYSGVYLDYRNPGDECGTVTRWPTTGGNRVALAGERDQVWILDVDGTRLVIDAFSFAATSDEDLAEMREMVESLDLGPPGP